MQNRTNLRWTADEDRMLREMAAAGKTTKEIAIELNRSVTAVSIRSRRRGITRARPRSSNTILLYKMISERAMTAREIGAALGMASNNVSRLIRALGDDVHIESWRNDMPGPAAARYRAGHGKDAKRPKRQPRSVVLRRYWTKLKRERPEEAKRRALRTNMRRWKKRADPAADWMNNRIDVE